MPFTLDRAELDRYAASLASEAELDLRGALAWFGADEDDPTVLVSRHDLQQFVHYTLPRKYLVGVEEPITIARALGDALDHLGAPAGYADLCRSPETLALLRLWEVDEVAAFAQCLALADASGLEPPDVDELQWQGVMGMVEARTPRRGDARARVRRHAIRSGDRALRARRARPGRHVSHATGSRAGRAYRPLGGLA